MKKTILQGCRTLKEFLNYQNSQGNSEFFFYSGKLKSVLIFFENFRKVSRLKKNHRENFL